MVSKEQKRAALHEKLQLLRSITNSHALNKTSIIIDASRYIEKLKQKVERLNQEIASAETSSVHNPLPMVTVETLEKGFLINVFSAKCCPGLLVSVLEVFEEMRLTVLEARVSCTDTFRFQAVGGENEEEGETSLDAQAVEQAVIQAIKNWSENADIDQE
ncbi:Helix-loop-helix DNA-binding domain superfamily [Sesbania bispinosa]|nr:Helix-loop-helix DNA-binding domain superfamily [Sesbania bispinosa]